MKKTIEEKSKHVKKPAPIRTAEEATHSTQLPPAPASENYDGHVFPAKYPCAKCGENDLTRPLQVEDIYSVTLANEAHRITEHAQVRIRFWDGIDAAGMLRDAARLCDLLEQRQRQLREEENRKEKRLARRGKQLARKTRQRKAARS